MQFSTLQQMEHYYYWTLNIERKNRVSSVSRLARPRNGWISGVHFPQVQKVYRAHTGSVCLKLHVAVLSVQLYRPYTSSGWAVLWLTRFVLEVQLVYVGHQLLCALFLRCQSNNPDCCITFAASVNHPHESHFDDRSKQRVQDGRIK